MAEPSPSRKHVRFITERGMPPAKQLKTDYSNAIKVLVGPKKASFTVHKARLCANSSFFQAASSGDWTEVQDRIISLPETSSYTFAVYTHWIYTGEVEDEFLEFEPPFAVMEKHKPYLPMACVYVSADMLGDIKLKNQCIDLMIAKDIVSEHLLGVPIISHVWSNTIGISPLRRWIVEVYATQASVDGSSAAKKSYRKLSSNE